MKGSKFVSIIVGVLLPLISALPQFTISEPVHLRRNVPQPPPRPEGVSQDNFHGSQFQFFDDIGFVAGSPGVEAAPVFLYSRTDPKTVGMNYPWWKMITDVFIRIHVTQKAPYCFPILARRILAQIQALPTTRGLTVPILVHTAVPTA